MNVSGGQFSRVFCAKLARTETFLSKPSVFPKEIWCILFLKGTKVNHKNLFRYAVFTEKVLVGVRKRRNAGNEKNDLISDLNQSNIRHSTPPTPKCNPV